ncbi:hypothetical protein PGT21_031369 [Puccinia graminis f. sp. tritici]|uniref:Uncharacterized protein n=1 Tax=Puccinia graminis f. sp. tritici TaxID=56615 RepID=A0A5B0S3T0_PUCGR|nr:hypothetical protein PGT21_031369 [Puccinia graminis f. sp. tritici]KAA1131374.1 hypothetical protein PGTUg99_033013 [Puccinia graminis f. sp. tritici]
MNLLALVVLMAMSANFAVGWKCMNCKGHICAPTKTPRPICFKPDGTHVDASSSFGQYYCLTRDQIPKCCPQEQGNNGQAAQPIKRLVPSDCTNTLP